MLATILVLGIVIIQFLLFQWVDSGILNALHIALFLVSYVTLTLFATAFRLCNLAHDEHSLQVGFVPLRSWLCQQAASPRHQSVSWPSSLK